METAINGTWDAELLVGERVGVVGAGVVGCLVAYLARRVIGCEVQLIDVDERKRTIAERLGLEFVTGDRVRGDLDCVFDTSGAPAGLRHALELAGTEARVVVMSWFGEGPVALPLGGAFHANRLRLVSSQVGGLPPHQRPRWTYRRRLELALRLLGDDDLDVLVSSESAFENLPATMEALSDPSSFVLCHRVVYG
jgi:threonine dehydrogenase-like Zn-dependent dehydrogenase